MTRPLLPPPARDRASRRPARLTVLAAGSVIGLLTLAACGSSSGGSASSTSQAAPEGLGTTTTSLGKVLTDSAGLTLYAFSADSPGQTRCGDECLVYWHSDGVGSKPPKAPPGVTAKLGVIMRPDGSKQLTVDNWPVYTYVGDHSTGDTTGQGLNIQGGLWWAVGTDGTWIKAGGTASSTSTTPYVRPGY